MQWPTYIKQNKVSNIPSASTLSSKYPDYSNSDLFNKNEYHDYLSAKKILENLSIQTIVKYQELHKKGKLPAGLPLNPNQYYTSTKTGWISADDFLSKKKKK